MKRIISTVLLSAMLLTVAGCGNSPVEKDVVKAISASADTYADWLTERLGEKELGEIIICDSESSSAYGIDLSTFHEGGYTIRKQGGSTVIAGKDDIGLDAAVRYFAKYATDADMNVTEGEGYRVKALTIDGHDISEYAVVRPDDADECMRYATDELLKYVKKACGTILPVFSASEYASASQRPARQITFKIDYPALGDEAFTIDVKDDGNLDILCGRYRGGLYGVYGLMNDIGWRFLGDGTEYLYKAESVDLTSAINRTEEPAIPNRFAASYPLGYDISIGNRLNYHARYIDSDEILSKYGYYGVVLQACHGLKEFAGDINWGGSYPGFTGAQPCFTNEDVLQAIEDHFRSYIETRIAAGDVPGKDFAYIDVSQFDSDHSGFCICADCMKVVAREGSATGPVIQMTNRMAEMAAEYSPDIAVLMLAYCGTNKPPRRTVPLDNVKVAYCYYYTSEVATCSNHTVAAETCSDGLYSNNILYREFEGWKEICPPENLQIWYYPMNGYEVAFQAPSYDTAFEDMKYFIESGIDCIMFCDGENNDMILVTALSRLIWDADITEEEYYDLLEEYFCLYYGADSGKLIFEYAMMIVKAGDLTGCFNTFGSRATEKVDHAFISAQFDYIIELFEKALELAESSAVEKRIEILKARMLYMAISVVHEDRYVNGTDEEKAKIAELYAEMHSLFLKYNIIVVAGNPPVRAPAECDVTKSPSEHWYPTISA